MPASVLYCTAVCHTLRIRPPRIPLLSKSTVAAVSHDIPEDRHTKMYDMVVGLCKFKTSPICYKARPLLRRMLIFADSYDSLTK